jgi:hypothetical protein
MLKVLVLGPSSKENRLENMSPPLKNSIIWDPPVILVELIPQIETGIQNTAFCKKTGIQSKGNHNKL